MNHRWILTVIFSVAMLLISVQSNAAQTATSKALNQSYRVGRYTFAGAGTVNTYWIETVNALIVIDLQRDLTHAKEALAAAKSIGKPVKAILLTHGHPDHFAGLGLFKEAFPDADIY